MKGSFLVFILILSVVFASKKVHKSTGKSPKKAVDEAYNGANSGRCDQPLREKLHRRAKEPKISPSGIHETLSSQDFITPRSDSTVDMNFLQGQDYDDDFEADLLAELDPFSTFDEDKKTHMHEFDSPNVGNVPDGFVWNPEEEDDWTLSDSEIRQYIFSLRGVTSYENFILSPTTAEIEASFSKSRLKYDMNWPGDFVDRPINGMSRKLFYLAVKLLLQGDVPTFRAALRAGLIELERPLYDSVTKKYFSYFSFAIENCMKIDFEKIILLLEYVPKHMINKPSSTNILPLQTAVIFKNLDLVKRIVEAGGDMNLSLDNGRHMTPFMNAVSLKAVEIVEYFLSTKLVDPNITLQDGTIAVSLMASKFSERHMFYLIVGGNKKLEALPCARMFEKLVAASEEGLIIFRIIVNLIIKKSLKQLYTSILASARFATRRNNLEVIRFLHASKVPLTIPLKSSAFPGFSLIHYAATHGHLEMIILLIDVVGADLDVLTDSKHSPLSIAYLYGYVDMACLLISKGAKIHLHQCIEFAIEQNNLQIIATFFSTYGNVDGFYFEGGFNLITRAIDLDKPFVLDFVLKSGNVDFTLQDLMGRSIFNTETRDLNASNDLKTLIKAYQEILNIAA